MDNSRNNAIELTESMLRENAFIKEDGGEYLYEIIISSYDETILGKDSLKNIMDSDNPAAKFSEQLLEMADDYKYDYGISFLMDELEQEFARRNLHDVFEESEDEIRDYIRDNVSFYYDEKEFNQDLNITIQIDTGDLNYDFTKCNILNFYGSGTTDIPETSPILWLCREMGEDRDLERIVEYYKDDSEDLPRPEVSPFIKSVENELINGASHMLQLTFLLRMGLQDYLVLADAIAREREYNQSYIATQRHGNGSVTISKNTTCGLMDFWGGGGSLFEIELPKDLEIPIRLIHKAAIDDVTKRYGVEEVYGFTAEPWKKGEILNIRPHTNHELYFCIPSGQEKVKQTGTAEMVLPMAKYYSQDSVIKVLDITEGYREFDTFINGREYTYSYDPHAAKFAEEREQKKKMSK